MCLATCAFWSVVLGLAPARSTVTPPPPGVYASPAHAGVTVTVFSPVTARVRWPDNKLAMVRRHEDNYYVADEPLARHMRQAGVVLKEVRYEADTDVMVASFDGRLCFSVPFVRTGVPVFPPLEYL